MTTPTTNSPVNHWRLIGWGTAAALLLMPFVAMQAGSSEVNWTPGDFIVAGVMLSTVGLAFELVVQRSGNGWYRLGAALALLTGLLLLWVNLAVGYIGDGGSPANSLLLGLPPLTGLAAAAVGFTPLGMARVMVGAGLVQAATVGAALATRLGAGEAHPAVVATATVIFVAMWLTSAALFRRAARS